MDSSIDWLIDLLIFCCVDALFLLLLLPSSSSNPAIDSLIETFNIAKNQKNPSNVSPIKPSEASSRQNNAAKVQNFDS